MPKVQVSLTVTEGAPDGHLPQMIEGRSALAVCVMDGERGPVQSFFQASTGADIVLMLACMMRHVTEEYGSAAIGDALIMSRDFGEPSVGHRFEVSLPEEGDEKKSP